MADVMDFEQAVAAVAGLTQDPGNEVKLKLYSLYKQATDGDASGKRPGFTDFVGRAKYDAWAKLAGTDAESAKAAYVEVVSELVGADEA